MPLYYTMSELIGMMHLEHARAAYSAVAYHHELFRQAPGSSHNHQAWTGGYWDHVVEVMNFVVLHFDMYEQTGRLAYLPPEEQFTLADALVVLFLHDIEKPWCYQIADGRPVPDERGLLQSKPGFKQKAARMALAREKIQELGFELTPLQLHGLRYVEGLRDHDYSRHERVIRPFGAFCHMCDLASARIFYDFPRATDDTWVGAARVVAAE